jgi:site-specific DNA recombinase
MSKGIGAIYCRISHEDQSAFSLPSQQEGCDGELLAAGYEPSGEFVFIDNGGLSTELDRPALAALREAVAAGVVKAVAIHSPDRLSRKVVHQLLLMEEFQKKGVEVLFVDAPSDNSPEGRMMLTMKAMFSEYEREKIRERTARGSRRRAKEGKINSRPPFGYLTTENGLLIPHAERADTVRRIFKLIVEGKACGEVAELLNRDGAPAPLGTRWIRGTVLQIVRRDAYATGKLAWGKTTATEPKRRRKPPRPGKDKKTSFKMRPASEWLHIDIPAIIDPTTFESAQRAIAANRKSNGGRPSQTYLLTGLLRCRCGAAVCGSYSHGYPYYKCCGVNPVTGKRACGERSIRLDVLEPQIWGDVVGTLSNRARLAALLNAQFAEVAAKEADHAAERAALTDQIEKLKRREFRARAGMLDSDLSDSYAAFREDLRDTMQRRLEAEGRLESIAPARVPARPESFSEFCRQMARARKITDRGQQRDFLLACIERITITREEVDVRFSLNLAAALAAIDHTPDADGGSGRTGRNCKLSQCGQIPRAPLAPGQGSLFNECPQIRRLRPSRNHRGRKRRRSSNPYGRVHRPFLSHHPGGARPRRHPHPR